MDFFTTPTSLRLANYLQYPSTPALVNMASESSYADTALQLLQRPPRHSSHPNLAHLTLLVFEAVLEVVCVSIPGYVVARQGMFDANAQKFVANLNVQVFTPCLIFTKLASQLSADKLKELLIIPLIFIAQTLISWMCAYVVSRLFGFKKRPRNFVIAMGVFGNSNSLPISLVLSLSKTISGLHWNKIPGDNDDEVGARGILYLLIFQQLGQLVRWSWGYNVLLAPAAKEVEENDGYRDEERAERSYESSIQADERTGLIDSSESDADTRMNSEFASGVQTPVNAARDTASDTGSSLPGDDTQVRPRSVEAVLPTPTNGNVVGKGPGNMSGRQENVNGQLLSFPSASSSSTKVNEEIPEGPRGWWKRCKLWLSRVFRSIASGVSGASKRAFDSLPTPVQKGLSLVAQWVRRFFLGVWDFMNPPLWAMLIALLVASVPPVQHLFFDDGTFIRNSVTRAVQQSGGVAVPLILVVLGANLARNTLPDEAKSHSEAERKEERNLLIAALISRMLLPTLLMAPLLALVAKFVPVSILGDPIFIIVCFLLTGAPSALQLAQICQINNVYMGAMSRLLFQSYVVWILPSTLILVMLALEVVEWATG